MRKYAVRSAKLSDLAEVHRIIAAQNTADFGAPMLTLEDLQKKWQNLDLSEDACVAFQENELTGYAELLEGDSPYIYLANRNDTDLAFQFLMILESKVTSRKKEEVKVNLFTRISEKNQTLLQLFASNGYQSNLSFLIMETLLTEPPPASQWADGLTVRGFVPGQDEEVTYRTDEEAAEDKGYHTPLSYEGWRKRMRMDAEGFDPSLWFLAFDGDELVGVALNLYAKESATGWVDHLSVRRNWRKRGIGKALLLHSFAEFHRRDLHRIKLSVDSKSLTNAPRLYHSVGMQTVEQYHIYRKEI